MPPSNNNNNNIKQEPEKVIKLLSYNLFLRPPLVQTSWLPYVPDHKDARLDQFIERVLKNYDIVNLQEVFKTLSPRHSHLLSIAKKLNYYNVSLSQPSLFSSLQVDGGLTILSKFPILSSDETFFNDYEGIDGYCKKGVLFAKIDLGGGKYIFLFDTHTQASYKLNPSPYGKDSNVRFNQFKTVNTFIHQCLEKFGFDPRTGFVILMGDLNVDSNADWIEYERMITVLGGGFGKVDDVLFEANERKHPVTFDTISPPHVASKFDLDNKYQSLDYILHFKKPGITDNTSEFVEFVGAKAERFETKGDFVQISDHYAVTATVKIKD